MVVWSKKNRNTAVNRPRFLWFHREKSPSKLYRSTVCWLGIGGSKPQGFHQNVAKGAWCWVSRLKPTNTSPTSTQHLPNWINTGLMWATRSLFRLAPNTMALMEFLARKHGPKTSPTSPIIGAASPSWTMGSTTLLAQRKLSILLSMSSVGFTGGSLARGGVNFGVPEWAWSRSNTGPTLDGLHVFQSIKYLISWCSGNITKYLKCSCLSHVESCWVNGWS